MPGHNPNRSGTPNGAQATGASQNTAYQPPMGSAPRSGESGDSNNNLFANGGRDLTAYCQRMEEQVKQLSEQVRAMEAEKLNHRDQVTRQQEQINQLSEELLSLRGNIGAQGQRLSAPGAS